MSALPLTHFRALACGSALGEGEDEIGDGEGHSEKSAGVGADIEGGWQ